MDVFVDVLNVQTGNDRDARDALDLSPALPFIPPSRALPGPSAPFPPISSATFPSKPSISRKKEAVRSIVTPFHARRKIASKVPALSESMVLLLLPLLSPSPSVSQQGQPFPLPHLHAALVGGREAARILGVRGVGPAGLPPGVERVLEDRHGRRRRRGHERREREDGHRASHLLGLDLMCC